MNGTETHEQKEIKNNNYSIIDSHTHVQRTSGFWDSPPERILALMDKAGIEKSVIMTYSDAPSLVDYIAQSVNRYPDRLIGYARLDPSTPCVKDILRDAVLNKGIKGLKLHPVGNLVSPSNPLSVDLIRLAGEMKIPTLFHCGDEEFTLPMQIRESAKQCPDSLIILGHMGGYFHVEDAILTAKDCPNVYLETSAMPYPQMIKKAVDEIGAHRVLFASDGPGCPPDLEVIKVKKAGLSQEDEKKLFYENISRILALNTP